ncbi:MULTISPECIES: heme lyase CcmF/NrfE family subunit [Rhodomicrobium]|uniref:heme lyase CcmF/NrfE family subunit n=1 Tax=Rhodomicrobium TaxID=1068 RepID=UPI000B4B6DE7|nr:MULTISPECIES: heme lyase CcmF/NrfE family subunit [Rhodomicrobium]
MIVEIGHFALILAFAVACLQTGSVAWSMWSGDDEPRGIAAPAALAQCALLALSFWALIWCYVVSDFSVQNVFANSHADKPLIYKISGAWGNHEGSMLLWVLILAIFGAAVAAFGNNLPARLKSNVLAVQGSIGIAFLAFIIVTSNPFTRIWPAPFEGQGLNPILQDPALAIHPPLLYTGYVGFSMAFSFAIAALMEGHIGAAWARWVRPWTLAAWMFLTVGIAMGSWWAYYELGWGGWWFWDPVENASFMPWLAGTALLHSAVVMEKRDALKVWTILLAIVTFALSLMGTFLVRSGVLTSVHAFAVDPARGVFILAILGIFTGGGLALFAWRAPQLRQGALFAPVSREGSLVFNNLLLMTICAAVLIGTLYPLALESITGDKISVGPPYFNSVFVPLTLILLITLPFGPLLPWKRGNLREAARRLSVAGAFAVTAGIVALILKPGSSMLAALGIGVGVWLIMGALSETAFRVKAFAAPWPEVLRRLSGLPRSSIGGMIAHLGVGVAVLGITATSAWRVEHIQAMKPGDRIAFAGYEVLFEKVAAQQGPNYQETFGDFELSRGGKPIVELAPSKRQYTAPPTGTSEAAIHASWAGDFYLVMGDAAKDGSSVAVRMYFNPLVRLIWIGAVIMFIGGGVSLSDRRLRIGAPARRRAPAEPVAGQA